MLLYSESKVMADREHWRTRWTKKCWVVVSEAPTNILTNTQFIFIRNIRNGKEHCCKNVKDSFLWCCSCIEISFTMIWRHLKPFQLLGLGLFLHCSDYVNSTVPRRFIFWRGFKWWFNADIFEYLWMESRTIIWFENGIVGFIRNLCSNYVFLYQSWVISSIKVVFIIFHTHFEWF